MSREFWLSLSAVCLVAWCVIAIACGGSKNNNSCNGGPYNVVGDWQITVTQTSGTSVSGYGAIDSNGLALFFDNSSTSGTGDTLEMPSITGSCSFSGNITDYEEPGGPFSGQSVVDTAKGNVTSAIAITGTFTGSVSSGSFSASTFSPQTSTVSVITGSKTGEVEGKINSDSILLPLIFSAIGTGDSMSFTGNTNPSCTVTGTFTQVGTANVFDVSMTFNSAAAKSCPITGKSTGIGFESNSDYFGFNGNNSSDTYLYADILASGTPFVMEIF
jgi:hypothetical protein